MSIKTEAQYFSSVIIRDISFFGSYVFVLVAFLLMLIFNQIQLAKYYFVGVTLVTAIELFIKVLYHNKRPDFKQVHPYSGFQKFEEGSSFPSGHSGNAALFTSLMHIYYHMLPLTIMFSIIAIYVGISRIFLKRHFIQDVLCGFAIGIGVAILTTQFLVL